MLSRDKSIGLNFLMPRGRGLKTLLAGKKPVLVQWWEAPAWERVEIVIAFKIEGSRAARHCHVIYQLTPLRSAGTVARFNL